MDLYIPDTGDLDQLSEIDFSYPDDSGLYTIIFYDVDAPSVEYYTHLLVINVAGSNIDKGHTVISYAPPSPSHGSGIHRYMFNVYLQEGNKKIRHSANTRTGIDVKKFVADKDLLAIYSKVITVDSDTFKYQVLSKEALILADSKLNTKEKAYCRCLVHVAEKSLAKSNPYAICRSSVKSYVKSCSSEYNYAAFSDSELKGYASLHKMTVEQPYNRLNLLQQIAVKNRL